MEESKTMTKDNLLSKYYRDNPFFTVIANKLVWIKTESEIIPLISGVLAITKEITELNGIDETIVFEISATDKQGKALKTIKVNSGDFLSLNWIVKSYGCKLPFSPNNATKQKIIQALLISGENSQKETIYTNTGYLFDFDNNPVNYLFFGGNILHDLEIKTDINPILSNYVLLDSDNKQEIKSVFDKTIQILELNDYYVTFPLLSFAFMPALKPVIDSVISRQSFGIYLKGKTQSGKSTIASIITSFYGCFDSYNSTCSFNATANGIQEISFILKDSINWIDDFLPRFDKQENKKQNLIMQNIARYIGDNDSRLKLNSDSTIRANHNARCFFIMTGENDLQIGQSGIARIFTIPLIRHNCNIIEFSNYAKKGNYTKLTSDFIRFVIANFEALKITFENAYNKALTESIERFNENRLSKQTALLKACFYCFLYYAKSNNFVNSKQAKQLYADCIENINKASTKSDSEIASNDLEYKYKLALSDLLKTGRKYLIDLFDPKRQNFDLGINENVIGYFDSEYIYLDSNLTYKAICEYWQNENEYFSITKNQIQFQLLKSGFFISSNDNPCIVKNIKGKSIRLLRIHKNGII